MTSVNKIDFLAVFLGPLDRTGGRVVKVDFFQKVLMCLAFLQPDEFQVLENNLVHLFGDMTNTSLLKFSFSEKATKIWNYLPLVLTFT